MSLAAPVETLSRDDAHTIAVDAYIYLYPLVTMELTRRQGTNVALGERPGFGPMGEFSHFRAFPDADFKAVVRPNFDTLYSSVWLDLTSEPMIVSAPDTDGRYYLLPMIDMWTDVFAVPGKRTTGTGAGAFAVVPPGWQGSLPDGVSRIDAPTRYVWIIGRTQTNGPDDYDRVHAIQDGFVVSPLSTWGREPVPVEPPHDPSVDMKTPTLEQVNALSTVEFFTLAAELMKLHAPHITDWSILAQMQRIGLTPGADFDHEALAPELRDVLDSVPAEAVQKMHASIPALAPVVDGWQMNTSSIGVYGNFYLKRAIVTLVGLGANPAEDAIYPLNIGDADGKPLDGSNDYVLHFDREQLPPVGAFWSVTMYDGDGFQAANELDRFALGDRDPLTYNEDGSLDLYLQHERPASAPESNWLPAPRGPLGVTMRLYAPKAEALDGRWTPPPIRRA